MAKNGIITSPSGADLNMRALGDTTPASGTLGGYVRQAFQLAAALKAAVVNFLTGKAVIAPTGAAAPAGLDLYATFTPVDPASASSAWTVETEEAVTGLKVSAIEGLVEDRAPKFSVESLIGAVEDLDFEPESPFRTDDKRLVAFFDQAQNVVKVYGGSTAAIAAYDPAAQYAEDAAFVRNIGSTTRQPGE